MVFPGEKEEDEEEDYTKKKRKTLHNFSFTDLKWGAQRSLRCSKIESNGGSPSPVAAVDQRLRRRSSPPKFGDNRSRGLANAGEEDDYEEEKTNKKEREMEVSPSWNLRKRRAACKEAPVTDSGGNNQKDEKGVRPKFNSTLSKKEVEDDFMAMVGHPPPRRPKKRPRNVQKRIDSLYPAFYFGEVKEDIYDVPDASENGKK
ncbi:hypothetical protein Rs2_39579 [Raphanus sativus]|uniref:Uncharacterized protein LOC108825895 n=1 Tax=Raphanus sativus TaxID=3726 RepID=A0A6J0L3P5_RAPSA|nr:uncharacterized protein LOC108825895 [Raphanus sativus]KAJ4874561.1 hypothetical protein Rs2_39579 [Raphanus sativus]